MYYTRICDIVHSLCNSQLDRLHTWMKRLAPNHFAEAVRKPRGSIAEAKILNHEPWPIFCPKLHRNIISDHLALHENRIPFFKLTDRRKEVRQLAHKPASLIRGSHKIQKHPPRLDRGSKSSKCTNAEACGSDVWTHALAEATFSSAQGLRKCVRKRFVTQHVLTWWFGLVVWKSGNWWFCEPGTNCKYKLNSTCKITTTQIAIISFLLIIETLYTWENKFTISSLRCLLYCLQFILSFLTYLFVTLANYYMEYP